MTALYTRPVAGDGWDGVGVALRNGIEDASTCRADTTDPSSGGTWAASRVGTFYFNRTNEVGAGGDDVGGALERWEKIAGTTHAMRSIGLRGYVAKEPNVSLISATATSVTAWTDIDVSGDTTSAYSVGVSLYVEVQESNPGAGVSLGLRKNGVTTDAHARRLHPQVASITASGMYSVELDTSGVFEYQVLASGNTSANVNIALCGYHERV